MTSILQDKAFGAIYGAFLSVAILLTSVGDVWARPDSFADLAEKLMPAVVNISTTQTVEARGGQQGMPPFNDFFEEFFRRGQRQPGGPPRPQPKRKVSSLGSGFIIDQDGVVITNNHVIEGADEIVVTLSDGTKLDATLVGRDPKTDLAVLTVKTKRKLPFVPLGDSSKSRVGDWVIAIGNPFGLDTTMTVGIVSALGREIDSISQRKIRDVIQTDAAINPGNSGGPLLNSLGQLVGVNTAIYSPSGASSGIGFAIPVNTVKRVVPELIAYGRVQTPILGITPVPQPDYYRRLWGIQGVIVMGTVPNTEPALKGMRGLSRSQRGRIQLGDVIVEIDGNKITNESDYADVMEEHRPGDIVEVITQRDNQRLRYEIELQAPQNN